MAAKFDVVFLIGPPFTGKTDYYHEHLSKSHHRISPSEETAKDQSAGFRHIPLKIVRLLKSQKKVVVDDENWYKKARDDYIHIIQTKVPSVKFGYVIIHPSHGCFQLWWSMEFALAEQCRFQLARELSNPRLVDEKIDRWFSDKEGKRLQYNRFESPDLPAEFEGKQVFNVSTEIQAHSKWKFDVPALFLEWEGIIKKGCDPPELVTGVGNTVNTWYKLNPCGRVIVVVDSTVGHYVQSSQDIGYQHILKLLASELEECPVFLFHLYDSEAAGMFTDLPNPGVLAFLQGLHCIDLQNKRTVYIHHTPPHLKMAESAGVKHMKGSKVFSAPTLVNNLHAFSYPPVPDAVRSIRVCQPFIDTDQLKAEIPLYSEANDCTECPGCVKKDLGFGRKLYLAFKNNDILDSYQKLYEDNATPVGCPSSRISDLGLQKQSVTVSQQPKAETVSLNDKSRDLPKWLIPKSQRLKDTKSQTSKESLQLSNGSSSLDLGSTLESFETTKVPKKSSGCTTIYVMNEEELLEMAKAVIREAGSGLQERGADWEAEVCDTKLVLNSSPLPDQSKMTCSSSSETSHSTGCKSKDENKEVDISPRKRSRRTEQEKMTCMSSSETSYSTACKMKDENKEKEVDITPVSKRSRRTKQEKMSCISSSGTSYITASKRKDENKNMDLSLSKRSRRTEQEKNVKTQQSKTELSHSKCIIPETVTTIPETNVSVQSAMEQSKQNENLYTNHQF